MKKIVLIVAVCLAVLLGVAAAYYFTVRKPSRSMPNALYTCPPAPFECVAGGPPGSLCHNQEYIDWILMNCDGMTILE